MNDEPNFYRIRWSNVLRILLVMALLVGLAFVWTTPEMATTVVSWPWSAQALAALAITVLVVALIAWNRLRETWVEDLPRFIRLTVAAALFLIGGLHGIDRATVLHKLLTGLDLPVLLLMIFAWVLAILTLLAWLQIKGWFLAGTIARIVGGLFFLAFLMVLVLLAVIGHPGWNWFPRILFVLVAIILPISLYWLFIFSRKQSILTEFLSHMVRLGIFDLRADETADKRRARIEQYLVKFEAAYGRVSTLLRQQVLKTMDPAVAASAGTIEVSGGVTNLFLTQAIVPLVMATVLLSVGWLIVLPVREEPKLVDALWSDLTPMTAAFLGAYAFSLQLLFRRYLRRDLRASAYLSVVIRFVTVIPFVWVLTKTIGPADRSLVAVGFICGWFPRFFWTMLRGAISKLWAGKAETPGNTKGGKDGAATKTKDEAGANIAAFPSMDPKMPLTGLEGLTLWHEARLEEEDIENVENMATADLVELMLVTRIAPDRLIDWVDQAILDTHLVGNPEMRAAIRGHGILQASQFIQVYRQSVVRGDTAAFEAIVGNSGRSRLRSLSDAIETNTNLPLIQRWKGLPQSPTPTPGRTERDVRP